MSDQQRAWDPYVTLPGQALLSAREQLLLSLEAGGHTCPTCQRLQPAAQHREDKVSLRGCTLLQLQVKNHLLENSKVRGLRTLPHSQE